MIDWGHDCRAEEHHVILKWPVVKGCHDDTGRMTTIRTYFICTHHTNNRFLECCVAGYIFSCSFNADVINVHYMHNVNHENRDAHPRQDVWYINVTSTFLGNYRLKKDSELQTWHTSILFFVFSFCGTPAEDHKYVRKREHPFGYLQDTLNDWQLNYTLLWKGGRREERERWKDVQFWFGHQSVRFHKVVWGMAMMCSMMTQHKQLSS